MSEGAAGEHDPRVVAAARQARVSLKPRLPRVFDEVVDIVNFDLVLVLDHFDLTEVRLPSCLQLACMPDIQIHMSSEFIRAVGLCKVV